MPEKEPKIYRETKQPRKLTPEEVKEMVEKYKKEHEGLLPEYFALPGEEKEEEREYSKETILAYEIKKLLERIELEAENFKIENIKEQLKSKINSGQMLPDKFSIEDAFEAIWYYTFLKQSLFWSFLKSEDQKWIEENIRDPQLIENAKKNLRFIILNGQRRGGFSSARDAVEAYILFKTNNFFSLLNSESQQWIEENIRDSQLIKNVEEVLEYLIRMQLFTSIVRYYVLLRQSIF